MKKPLSPADQLMMKAPDVPAANDPHIQSQTTDVMGLPIPGYRPQPQKNLDLVEDNKYLEEMCLRRIDELKGMPDIDQRWLAIGKTDLEAAFMAINRAVFRPERIRLPDEIEDQLL